MKRDRGYYRRQRKKTIRRKERILGFWGNSEEVTAWTRGANVRLSKGKIHCSCPLCRRKSYDDPTVHDKRAMGLAKDMVKEYVRMEAIPYDRQNPQQAE